MKLSRNLIGALVSALIIFSMLLTACGGGEKATATPKPEPTAAPVEPTAVPVEPTQAPEVKEEFRVGMISDVGGVDDASFNQTTWEGLERADNEIEGVAAQFLESQAQADYENNITEFAEQGYDMIITVGFLLGDATQKMAEAYPDIKFAIIDYAYDPPIPNVQGIVFNTDEASFLGGYLAAGMAVEFDSADPYVGYVGGMQIPPVEIFFVGFESGIAYYNEQKGTNVRVSGVYVGDFEAPDEGSAAADSLLDEGVDVLFGAGGKTGNGALVAVRERAEAGAAVAGIGVDVDQYYTLPNEKGILLTSIEKKLDNAVFNAVNDAVEGNFGGGGVYVGMLENDGVGLAPYHDWEEKIPDDLKAEVEALRPQLIAGTIDTGWPVGEEKVELSCAEPIKIGLITDLTGALAIYGTMTERSFMLGMEYGTGAPGVDDTFTLGDCEVQVLVRDDQGSAETTATLARELIEVDDVDILVGTVSSGSTATLQEIALENDVVLVVAPAAANDITGINFNDHTFRTSRENYQDFINLCAYLTTQYDTFAQIAPDYSFGYGGAQSARDACTFFGGEFVLDDIFAPLDTTEFTPYLEQILDSGAEAWIVTWAGGGFVPMFNTASELGLMDELGIGASFFDNLTMQAIFQPVIGQTSGILYCHQCPDNPINDWLVEQVKERHGVPPDLFDADGMNAALLVLEAIQATGGDTSAAALIPTMEGLEFEGPKGTIYIRPEDHVAIQDMYIVKLDNLDDPDFNFYEVVDTTRPDPPCLLPEDMQDRCGDLPIGSLSGE